MDFYLDKPTSEGLWWVLDTDTNTTYVGELRKDMDFHFNGVIVNLNSPFSGSNLLFGDPLAKPKTIRIN